MNKSDLVERVAELKGCSVTVAKNMVDEIFSCMTAALVVGGRIEIRGFGSFALKEYDSYVGRNPRTGVNTVVAAKKSPVFKVGAELKNRIMGTHK